MHDSRTDEEIDAEILHYTEVLNTDINNLTHVTKYLLLIQKDQNEIQRRILEEASNNSKKAEKVAVCLAVISTILSFVAVWFSYSSTKTDDAWQEQEIQLLKEIRDKDVLSHKT